MPRRPSGRHHMEPDKNVKLEPKPGQGGSELSEARDKDFGKFTTDDKTATPDKKAEQGDNSAVGSDTPYSGGNLPQTEEEKRLNEERRQKETGGGSGENLKVEKQKALSKEELIQSPTGGGEVKIGEQEVQPDEADQVLARAQKILEEFAGVESNIGVDNEYWVLMNKYRGLAQAKREKDAIERERNK